MRATDAARMQVKEEIPLDIKLMNITATLVFAAVVLMLIGSLIWWGISHPVFSISQIVVLGSSQHNNEVTLRANVTPKINGNFFTIDLVHTRAIFESVPWVRHAIIEREFPNQLNIQIVEHQPVAYWGPESESRLLNSAGEVFVANFDELENTKLPHLYGSDSQSTLVLQMFGEVSLRLKKLDLSIKGLELTGRGSWRALLQSGADIELGRGTVTEVMARLDRMTSTLVQVAGRYNRKVSALESADLRHENGYALRLRGVSTLEPALKK